MSDGFKTLVFAALLCLVCSLLLTTASTGLKGYQERNVRVDRQKNILKAVGLIDENRNYESRTVQSMYAESIQGLWVDESGVVVSREDHGPKNLPIYLHVRDGRIASYVVPVDSRGLWGRIYGYLAIAADGMTVQGFTVYKHSETPGLGGEIERKWFQKNFENKKIVNRKGEFVAIGIAKGAADETVSELLRPHYVDGISGATLTGKFLSSGLRETLSDYEAVSIRFRKNLPVVENSPTRQGDDG